MLLLVSDIHLNDSLQDNYRWRIFNYLAKAIEKYKVTHVVVLGDITDSKDHHSALLVNKVVERFRDLAFLCPVIVLRGNHDCIDADVAFFRFLDYHPNTKFISKPTEMKLCGKRALFLPHTSSREGYNGEYDFRNYDWIFCHQTFHGVRGENGRALPGISPTVFAHCKGRVYSGDVHVPQRLGRVEYVGAPYHLIFGGTNFIPRIILDGGNEMQEVLLKTTRKHTIVINSPEQLEDIKLREGDHIKCDLRLFRSDFGKWDEYRKEIKHIADKANITLCGVRLVEREKKKVNVEDADKRFYLASPKDIFNGYCHNNQDRIDAVLRAAGEECLR